jgi:choline dehydrogenase-like flavoprotein
MSFIGKARRVVESDVCIIGSGISAAMVAAKLTDERRASIIVVEAGNDQPPTRDWAAYRQRFMDYGATPWPNDHIEGIDVPGIQSRSMCVGGLAMHWGGVTPRFAPEDFKTKSMCGVGYDWPISYEDLEPHYYEAEVRMGVSGGRGPAEMDPRANPFPMPELPLTYNLGILKRWVGDAGVSMWSQPSAKNSQPYKGRGACCRNDTCFPICPVSAKYSPDQTWNPLRTSKKISLHTRTVVRRLVIDDATGRITGAIAVNRARPAEEIEFRAKTFVVAGGYVWSAHLLLNSRSTRFAGGAANRAGLVGKYLTGHRNVGGYIDLPVQLYPGINEQHSLVSKQFMRKPPGDKYIRHDLRVWESSVGREPRLKDDAGNLLVGDALLRDWRTRTSAGRGTARVRSYYDIIPARESELTLDTSTQTPWGDPLPKLAFRDDAVSRDLRGATEDSIRALFERLAKAGNGRVIRTNVDNFQDHPAGGCRMGTDASTGVVDSHGRAFDHENLFVVGAPTMVSGSCANGTLTFCALALRSATEIGKALPAAPQGRG